MLVLPLVVRPTPTAACTASNVLAWPELRVSVIGLRRPVILVDHAAKDLPALHRPVQRHDDRLVLIRWPLVPGLVRTVPVIVPHVARSTARRWLRRRSASGPCTQTGLSVPSVRHSSFARGVRGRDFTTRTPALARTASNVAVKRGVAVTDEEPERADPVTDVHQQVAGLLRGPAAVRVSDHPEDMGTRRVATSTTNSTYRHLRKIVSTVKKSHASRPSAWTRRKERQEVSRPRGAGGSRGRGGSAGQSPH